MKRKKKIHILFVCHGNICRSPAAEGTFRKLVSDHNLSPHFLIDSAGTSGYHIGEEPHPYTIKVAREFGITINHRARQFTKKDFEIFDYILAMDHSNYKDILRLATLKEEKNKVFLFRKWDPIIKDSAHIPDVPDPYYGGIQGFYEVQKIILRTAENLLQYWIQKEFKTIKK